MTVEAIARNRAGGLSRHVAFLGAGVILVLIGLAGLAVVWHQDAGDRWFPAAQLLAAGTGAERVMTFETPSSTGYEIELVTLGWQQLPEPSGGDAVLEWSASHNGEILAAGQPKVPFYRASRKDKLKQRLKALMLGAHEGYPDQWWPQSVALVGLGRFRADSGQTVAVTVRSALPDAWVQAAQPLLRVRVRRQDWEAHLRAVKPWAYASALMVVVGMSLVVGLLFVRRGNR